MEKILVWSVFCIENESSEFFPLSNETRKLINQNFHIRAYTGADSSLISKNDKYLYFSSKHSYSAVQKLRVQKNASCFDKVHHTLSSYNAFGKHARMKWDRDEECIFKLKCILRSFE